MKKYNCTNKIIIIGNGFDLAHGLKTSYKDFIVDYFNSCVKKFNKRIIARHEDFIDDLIQIRKPEYGSISMFSNLENVKKLFLNNAQDRFLIRCNFFRELISLSDPNWVDIEAFYYEKVKEIFDQTNSEFGTYDEKVNLLKRHKVRINELNAELNFIKNNLITHLRNIDLSVRPIPEISQFFEEIYKSCDANDSVPKLVHILNFNYTNIVEEYLSSIQKKDVNFIHGDLLRDDSNIIFGYGDEEDKYYPQIEELHLNDYFTNFKSFGYALSSNYQSLLKIMNSEIFEVFILGHSCGFSDRVLLKSIFEHSHCSKIHLKYHKWGNQKSENDFIHKTMEISRFFTNKSMFRARLVNFEESEPLI